MPRWAVVTGASSGIGEAFAERLARDGWHLVVVARRRDRLEALAHRLHGAHEVDVRPLPADLGRAEDVGRLCTEIDRTAPDMLVNNAGLAHYAPFAELDPGRAEELVALNALAPVLLTRAAVPGMLARGRGSVVNVASLLAFSGAADLPYLPARAVYAATKAFLVTFTEVLAAELRGTGVRVQVICPGVVRSEFHSRQGMDLSGVPRWSPTGSSTPAWPTSTTASWSRSRAPHRPRRMPAWWRPRRPCSQRAGPPSRRRATTAPDRPRQAPRRVATIA